MRGVHERHLGRGLQTHPEGAWTCFDDGAEDVITTADLEKFTLGRAYARRKVGIQTGHHPRRPVEATGQDHALDFGKIAA